MLFAIKAFVVKDVAHSCPSCIGLRRHEVLFLMLVSDLRFSLVLLELVSVDSTCNKLLPFM